MAAAQGFRGGTLTSDNSWTTTPVGHDQVRQLTISVDYQYRQVQRQDSVGPAGSSTPESTYALIAASMAPDPGYHANAGRAVASGGSVQMSWLPPTKANFALFNVHVPAGFAEAS